MSSSGDVYVDASAGEWQDETNPTKKRIVVLGADSLLARHVVLACLDQFGGLAAEGGELLLWTYWDSADDLSARFHQEESSLALCQSAGLSSLPSLLSTANLVFNCHDFFDATLLPDTQELRRHNVDLCTLLVSVLPPSTPLIHISSVFVQTTSRWPNVYEMEVDASKYQSQWPFQAYCSSKSEGEQVVLSRPLSVVLRVPPLYGEGDISSPVTDLLRLSSSRILASGAIPVLGDRGGVLQMSYAGNVAAGVLRAAASLQREAAAETEPTSALSSIRKIFLLTDASPKKDIYSLALPLIQDGKRHLVSLSLLPFISLLYLYALFALILRSLSTGRGVPRTIRQLPDPNVPYFWFHSWMFFNPIKARLHLNHIDEFSHDVCVSRSAPFYRRLSPDQIGRYSWQPPSPPV